LNHMMLLRVGFIRKISLPSWIKVGLKAAELGRLGSLVQDMEERLKDWTPVSELPRNVSDEGTAKNKNTAIHPPTILYINIYINTRS